MRFCFSAHESFLSSSNRNLRFSFASSLLRSSSSFCFKSRNGFRGAGGVEATRVHIAWRIAVIAPLGPDDTRAACRMDEGAVGKMHSDMGNAAIPTKEDKVTRK